MVTNLPLLNGKFDADFSPIPISKRKSAICGYFLFASYQFVLARLIQLASLPFSWSVSCLFLSKPYASKLCPASGVQIKGSAPERMWSCESHTRNKVKCEGQRNHHPPWTSSATAAAATPIPLPRRPCRPLRWWTRLRWPRYRTTSLSWKAVWPRVTGPSVCHCFDGNYFLATSNIR